MALAHHDLGVTPECHCLEMAVLRVYVQGLTYDS
jgi:hypothetical protein